MDERTYRFGPFELTSSPIRLKRDGQPVEARSQVLRVLELLVSRAGDVVSRDEIREMLWGGDRHLEFEQAVNGLLYEARKVLGDRSDDPRYIETVPRSGYRFVAPVSYSEGPPLVSREDPTPVLARAGWKVAAAVLAVVVGLGSWFVLGLGRATPLPRVNVAVDEVFVSAGTSPRLAVELAEKLTRSLVREHQRALAIVLDDDSGSIPEVDYSAEVAVHESIDRIDVEVRLVSSGPRDLRWMRSYPIVDGEMAGWCEMAARDLALAVLVDWNEAANGAPGFRPETIARMGHP